MCNLILYFAILGLFAYFRPPTPLIFFLFFSECPWFSKHFGSEFVKIRQKLKFWWLFKNFNFFEFLLIIILLNKKKLEISSNIKKFTKISVFAGFSKTFNQNVWNIKGFQKKFWVGPKFLASKSPLKAPPKNARISWNS